MNGQAHWGQTFLPFPYTHAVEWMAVPQFGHEYLRISPLADGVAADGLVMTVPAQGPIAAMYRIEIGDGRATRSVRVAVAGGAMRSLFRGASAAQS